MSLLSGPTSDVPTSSTYDMGFEQSDMEFADSMASSDESVPKDYWFGRKYFDCIMAQDVLQRSRLHDSVAQVDSQLERNIWDFPYAQSLRKLREQDLELLFPVVDDDTTTHGAYRTIMFCIGAVVRSGDRRQKAALLAVLRQHAATPGHPAHLPSQSNASGGADTRRSSQKGQRVFEGTWPEADLGRYATALKEHGDEHGFVPVYKVIELSIVPPQFQASLIVEGSLFEGLAKTKKQARHEAARMACREMDIEV